MIAPVSCRTRSSRMVLPAAAHVGAYLDLGHVEIGAGGGRHGVEERGHLRLEHEVRHRAPGGRVRQHDAIGAGEHQLLLGVLVGGARDDLQVGPRGARRKRRCRGCRRRSRRRRRAPARDRGPRVRRFSSSGGVALDSAGRRRSFAAATASSWKSSTRYGTSAAGTPRRRAADAAVAADDEVVVQLFDRPLPPAFCQRAREDAAGDRLDDNRTGVGDDRQTGQRRARSRRPARRCSCGTVSRPVERRR